MKTPPALQALSERVYLQWPVGVPYETFLLGLAELDRDVLGITVLANQVTQGGFKKWIEGYGARPDLLQESLDRLGTPAASKVQDLIPQAFKARPLEFEDLDLAFYALQEELLEDLACTLYSRLLTSMQTAQDAFIQSLASQVGSFWNEKVRATFMAEPFKARFHNFESWKKELRGAQNHLVLKVSSTLKDVLWSHTYTPGAVRLVADFYEGDPFRPFFETLCLEINPILESWGFTMAENQTLPSYTERVAEALKAYSECHQRFVLVAPHVTAADLGKEVLKQWSLV